MRVTEELAAWPEREERRRDWLNVQEAIARCTVEWMRSAIRQWADPGAPGVVRCGA